jgi:signal transduction histidine kinase
VIACNNDGVWNATGTQASLIIEPFFYQTLPFYISVGCLLLITLFLIYKWRLRILENRNQELKKLNSELDKFVYSASHDLRAPLSSILGLVNVARQEPDQNKVFYLNLIEKSIHKLDQFIRDIIDFSRNARLDLVKEEINFELLIRDILEEMKYMDEKNRILRTIQVIGQGPYFSDSRRLVIILNNLVSNAIKYHNPLADNPYIEIRVELDSHQARINVNDNGHGIAQEHLSNIFKMFYRATEASKGSGLGLYIVHETVEKLSGKVSVSSTLGVGSTFEVTLPSLR